MFIRFVCGEVDARSYVEAGLFSAAYRLAYEHALPEYEYDQLLDLLRWFSEHLESPSDFRLRQAWRMSRAICWFKDSAHEHLAKAREMVALLENNGIYIRTIKSERPGYVLYEDEAQVFAQPFADTWL
jgi:hypothetical protein